MIETQNHKPSNRVSEDCHNIDRDVLRKRFVNALVVVIFIMICILWISFFFHQLTWPMVATLVGGVLASVITYFTFHQKQEVEEIRLFHDLFVEFNQRYDKLNEKMNVICEASRHNDFILNQEQRQILFDYFNLCGEEYFYFSRGVIYEEAWRAWCVGMNHFLSNPKIKEAWDEEQKEQGSSYYGLTCECIQEVLPKSTMAPTTQAGNYPEITAI